LVHVCCMQIRRGKGRTGVVGLRGLSWIPTSHGELSIRKFACMLQLSRMYTLQYNDSITSHLGLSIEVQTGLEVGQWVCIGDTSKGRSIRSHDHWCCPAPVRHTGNSGKVVTGYRSKFPTEISLFFSPSTGCAGHITPSLCFRSAE
jgi:hypothetical protein